MQVSGRSSGRVRPTRSGTELRIWYLMRLTGVALFVLALAHFSILHFLFDPADQTAEFIANQRWNQLFWRVFDWLLLMTVLFHGFLGMRTVVGDYLHGARARVITMSALYGVAALLFVMGTAVILTLPPPGPR
jgi:succinate dehydrogenase / fumarate reductase membrane anchor subunit